MLPPRGRVPDRDFRLQHIYLHLTQPLEMYMSLSCQSQCFLQRCGELWHWNTTLQLKDLNDICGWCRKWLSLLGECSLTKLVFLGCHCVMLTEFLDCFGLSFICGDKRKTPGPCEVLLGAVGWNVSVYTIIQAFNVHLNAKLCIRMCFNCIVIQLSFITQIGLLHFGKAIYNIIILSIILYFLLWNVI